MTRPGVTGIDPLAETTVGCGHTIEALPLEPTVQLLRKMSLVK